MATKSLTYGVLPTREEFEAAFGRTCMITHGGQRRFRFANDPRVGTCALTTSEVWEQLRLALDESFRDECGKCWGGWEDSYRCSRPQGHAGQCEDDVGNGPGDAGQWCSDVLGVLGFEWV